MWELLLPQTELTLNLLRQATLYPTRSAWSYFHGPFNYDATPIGYLGCDIIAHRKIETRNSWDFCGAAGWYVGVALQHYRCHTIVAKTTHAEQISDTVEFIHHHLTQPEVTPMNRIVHGMNKLTCALQDAPHIACDNQLFAINVLHQAIQRCSTSNRPPHVKPPRATPLHTRAPPRSILQPMRHPREDRPPAFPPRVVIPMPLDIPIPQIPTASPEEPIAHRTRSRLPSMDRVPTRVHKTIDTAPMARHTRSQTANVASAINPSQAAQRRYPAKFLQSLAMPVLDEFSGQSLQYRQLRKHPKFAHIWNTSYANELGRICQGIGKG